jgi:putative two-component system response regulator
VRAEVLRQTRLNIVQALGMAAEYKDNETGLHVIRMSHFSRIIALEAGFSPDEAEELLHAAPMHDVGKIGIPDAILQKPGKLDENEWLIMQKHPEIGAQIIGEHNASMLQMARRIALGHHEKWDGSGYPAGLAGDDIPIEARIVAIADVFDALTSVRPYKKAWTVEDAVALIREQSGRHFDPQLVECFIRRLDEINQIRERWAE